MVMGWLLLCAGLFYLNGCKKKVNPLTGETEQFAFTADQANRMGNAVFPLIVSRYGGPSTNTKASAILNTAGDQLVESTILGTLPLRYEFHLLRDNGVEALVLPDGKVCITEGMYKLMHTEDQLAAVLSHMLAHAGSNHTLHCVSNLSISSEMLHLLDSQPAGDTAYQVIEMIFADSLSKCVFTLSQEIQADSLALEFLSQAGYDPRALTEMLQLIKARSDHNGPPAFLKKHQGPVDRLDRIEAFLDSPTPGPGN